MDITITFVEYDAVNGLRDLTPVAFSLVSSATIGAENNRTWVLHGSVAAFQVLRQDLNKAMGRFQRASIAAALADVAGSIDAAIEAVK
jgi:hypothetical protein